MIFFIVTETGGDFCPNLDFFRGLREYWLIFNFYVMKLYKTDSRL